ncbi:MAG: hypothetical protein JXB14_05840 [Candidatus Altiarchaeota archaeon]|nr:hypothetical protein [Candidatus Altiarchaeota archaeon]
MDEINPDKLVYTQPRLDTKSIFVILFLMLFLAALFSLSFESLVVKKSMGGVSGFILGLPIIGVLILVFHFAKMKVSWMELYVILIFLSGFGALFLSLIKYEDELFIISMVLLCLGLFLLFLLRTLYVKHLELSFENDSLHFFMSPKWSSPFKIPDIESIVFEVGKYGFKILVNPKERRFEFFNTGIIADVIGQYSSEETKIIEFLKSGLEKRGYVVREERQGSIAHKNDIRLEFRKP